MKEISDMKKRIKDGEMFFRISNSFFERILIQSINIDGIWLAMVLYTGLDTPRIDI